MGVSLALKAGLVIALISGEDSNLVDRFAIKFGLTDVYKGSKDKAASLRDFAQRRGLELQQIAFMGDDVNDVEAMRLCGLAAAPANAHPAALRAATFVSERSGGHGAVREMIDCIIDARRELAEVAAPVAQ